MRPAEDPLGVQLSRTAKVVSRSFDDALAARGGTLATWLVLVSLLSGDHSTQRGLAEAVGIEGPTLTHHLNRMEQDGLVTRTRDPQNRRVHVVELTPDGTATFHHLLGAVIEFDQQLRAGFDEDELATFRGVLERLRTNVGGSDV